MMANTEWRAVYSLSWFLLAGAAVAILFGTLFSVMAMRVGEINFVAFSLYRHGLGDRAWHHDVW